MPLILNIMDAKKFDSHNMTESTELVMKDEVYALVGAALDVHKILGCGFLEPVYQEALAFEFSARGIPYQEQFKLKIKYKERFLNKGYAADFLVYNKIILEIKAEEHILQIDHAQVINYLKASGMEVGVLINFGSRQMEWKRFVHQLKNPLYIKSTGNFA